MTAVDVDVAHPCVHYSPQLAQVERLGIPHLAEDAKEIVEILLYLDYVDARSPDHQVGLSSSSSSASFSYHSNFAS